MAHNLISSSNKNGIDALTLLESLPKHFSSQEVGLVEQACALAEPLYAEKTELTNAPLLQHAVGAAFILAKMNMDCASIVAVILHALPAYLKDWQAKVLADFGKDACDLIEGISRMEQIRQFSEMSNLHASSGKKSDQAQQIETLRKMLLAMVQDIRVVLIKLAERTQTMRNLSNASVDQQKLIARETQGIFAPLANRLGVWQIKWELEDLSLRYLEPDRYKQVAKLLDERRADREQYIADVLALLKQELQQAGVTADVTGRPKHIYSIINKMKRKNLEFSELYDVRAVRILVPDLRDCYTALGLVHNLWQPIPGEFDDYIAHPKNNGYRSLHTAVIGPRDLAIEVQIRTTEMHQHSELGVAAHWRYKEGGKSDVKFDEKISWLRQILEWKEDVADSGDMLEQFKSELFQDHVYVLTPQGKVIDLPKGATPVDFSYSLHTDLGHRTRGAKVNGNIVPLSYKLQNGQRVEILTSKIGAPSRDWLSPNLGYLQSNRARAKVRQWFKMQNFDENVAQGRAQLDKELHRLGVISLNQEKLAQRLHFNKLEDFLAAIGRNEITQYQIATAIQDELPSKPEEVKQIVPRTTSTHKNISGVLVQGVGNLLTKNAQCCHPEPPDEIIGYVTRDRGITLHRKDCRAIQHIPENRRDRVLDAQWGSQGDAFVLAKVRTAKKS
ncbi:MAG: bifunctional (p)ppGpp synthetase/guanosine-3',5'-bis(diphosphate) 3'-pyrophosphohydrolase [Gallionellaceae bacterium]